jgi:hypothetical protein
MSVLLFARPFVLQQILPAAPHNLTKTNGKRRFLRAGCNFIGFNRVRSSRKVISR